MKILLLYLLTLKNSLANPVACPVCAVAIVSGFGLSRMLGVSDNVVGIWFGAILLAISSGIIVFLKKKKNINNKFLNLLIYLLDYSLVLPVYMGANPKITFNENKILFIDSFLFSIILGSLTLFLSSKFYYYMKNKNGRAHFPFEKVVLPIILLIVVSVIVNFCF